MFVKGGWCFKFGQYSWVIVEPRRVVEENKEERIKSEIYWSGLVQTVRNWDTGKLEF